MTKQKRFLGLLMSILLILSSVSVVAFAYEKNENFDISDYTWDDIMSMSSAEYLQLLHEFEKKYDPFDTYEKDPLITSETLNGTSGGTISPLWTSGDYDSDNPEEGSHELITARACGILLSDKGFWGGNHNGSILIALSLSLASILPDRDQNFNDFLFAGHFYNPYTQGNYLGITSNTAKTNTIDYYNMAKKEYETNGASTLFIEYVGRMIHYLQDANEPHHAANITGLNPAHSAFEKFAYQNFDTYAANISSVSASEYQNALSKSADGIVHQYALIAYDYRWLVLNYLDQSEWGTVANVCTQNAIQSTALLLYKLSIDASIPLQ